MKLTGQCLFKRVYMDVLQVSCVVENFLDTTPTVTCKLSDISVCCCQSFLQHIHTNKSYNQLRITVYTSEMTSWCVVIVSSIKTSHIHYENTFCNANQSHLLPAFLAAMVTYVTPTHMTCGRLMCTQSSSSSSPSW